MADLHQTLDLNSACKQLATLHAHVARTWGRLIITPGGSSTSDESACVLISKAELDHLERALEILCELPGGHEICQSITRVADQCMRSLVETPRSQSRVPGGLLADGDASSLQA